MASKTVVKSPKAGTVEAEAVKTGTAAVKADGKAAKLAAKPKAAAKAPVKAPVKAAEKPAVKAAAKPKAAAKTPAKAPVKAAEKAPAPKRAAKTAPEPAPATPVAAEQPAGKSPGRYKQATAEAERIAAPERRQGEGYVLHEYPSYQAYVDVQTAGNKAKLRRQFVKRSHVERLSAWLQGRGQPVTAGICHGTRAGREQRWFRKALACKGIFGTEISDTATEFPFTQQWDFHDVNPDWLGRFDFVYSNSWDHAFDPKRAFAAWIGQLRPGGVLLLDYTRGQAPGAANALDPFGADLPALAAMLAEVGREAGAGPGETLDFRDNPEYRAQVVVMVKG